ncbi:unnamed protein product, partial [Ixodes pacificus]
MADGKRWQRFMEAGENTPAIRYSPVTSRKNITCHDPRKVPPPATRHHTAKCQNPSRLQTLVASARSPRPFSHLTILQRSHNRARHYRKK